MSTMPKPSAIAVVFLGGIVGVSAREALALAFPASGGIPWTIFAINVIGAFLLGLLLEGLARRGADKGRRFYLRMLLGTGVLGSFTTYSSLATDTALLLGSATPWLGVSYGLLTLLVGGLASFAGVVVATLAHRARIGATR